MSKPVALLVEDDDDMREAASTMLEEVGFTVIALRTVKAALEALEWLQPEIVLTDLATPGSVNGCELAAKAKRAIPETRVICSTGHAGCEEPRCDRFLKKPYTFRELVSACGYMAPPHLID